MDSRGERRAQRGKMKPLPYRMMHPLYIYLCISPFTAVMLMNMHEGQGAAAEEEVVVEDGSRMRMYRSNWISRQTYFHIFNSCKQVLHLHIPTHVVIISFLYISRKGIEVNERRATRYAEEEHFSQIKDNIPHPANELKLLKGIKVNPKFINLHNPSWNPSIRPSLHVSGVVVYFFTPPLCLSIFHDIRFLLPLFLFRSVCPFVFQISLLHLFLFIHKPIRPIMRHQQQLYSTTDSSVKPGFSHDNP